MIRAVLIDFGGVIAEEGFREGLKAIARANKLDPEGFYTTADKIIYETGYLTGNAGEPAFWNALRQITGIQGSDQHLRAGILNRFVLRPAMLAFVDNLRSRGLMTALLSDQTNWLDEIDGRTHFMTHFDRVFNSYHIHKSKRDASLFSDACRDLGTVPEETVFIDDNRDHIRRAASRGLQTLHFTSFEKCEQALNLLTRQR